MMTRHFLEIKNITCAEPSFFILLYFLCKNLLCLCAEHHYPLHFRFLHLRFYYPYLIITFIASFNTRRNSPADVPLCKLIKYKSLRERTVPEASFAFASAAEHYAHVLSRVDILSDEAQNLAPFYRYN
jgi:hypothetical protein